MPMPLLTPRHPNPLIHLSSVVFDSPLAIIPSKLEAILRAVGPRLAIDQPALSDLLESGTLRNYAGDFDLESPAGTSKPDKPYLLTDSGIAILPIRGTLMKSGGWMSAMSGCSSYQGVRAAFDLALDDPKVRAILFDVDSPGGTTHGCFELSDYIRSRRGDKPMCACANDLAASAAYALASAADNLWVTSTGAVGSVGVFALHVSQESLDEKTGLKYEYIQYGAKKTEGNPHSSLSKGARADMQAEVDREGEIFTACVASNRHADADDIRSLEAAVRFGAGSVPLLADEVGTLADTLAYLESVVDKRSRSSVTLRPGRTASVNTTTMPAIPPHKTSTSAKSWDGPGNKRRLREDEVSSYYRKAYAFQNPAPANPRTKAGYKFCHHEVSGDGSIGAANLRGCSSSIAILNGGRKGTVLKGGDRKGVYAHVSAHLRDAGKEPSPLASYRDYLNALMVLATTDADASLATSVADALATTDFSVVDVVTEGIDTPTTAEKAEGVDPMAKKADEACDEKASADYMKKGKKGTSEEEEKKAAKSKPAPEDDEEEEEEEEEDEKEKKAASAASDEEEEEEEEKENPPAKKKSAKPSKTGTGVEKKSATSATSKDEEDEEDEEEPPTPAPKKKSTKANSAAIEIAELCTIAGHTELIPKYLSEGRSVDTVRRWLSARRVRETAENPVNSTFSFGAPAGQQSSLEKAVAQAQSMAMNSGGNLSRSQALQQILSANPQVYDDYDEDRRRVGLQGTNKDIVNFANSQRKLMAALKLGTEFGAPPAGARR